MYNLEMYAEQAVDLGKYFEAKQARIVLFIHKNDDVQWAANLHCELLSNVQSITLAERTPEYDLRGTCYLAWAFDVQYN